MTKSGRSERGVLPHALTSIAGRRDEMTLIRRALQESSLASLTGPGDGNTRLALHASEQVRRGFPDGVHFGELTTVRDPALVIHALAVALDVRDQSDRSRRHPGFGISEDSSVRSFLTRH
jgi:hypothetical protein